MHKEQKKNQAEYIFHPIAVAKIAAEIGGATSIAAP
jgi:(p)ppGpp synthase/HD superfamily hydrolase